MLRRGREVFVSLLLVLPLPAGAEPARWASFELIDLACANRSGNEFGRGLCHGYLFGLVDAQLTALSSEGRRFCLGAQSHDHAVDLILSRVQRPRDVTAGADVFYSKAILSLAKPCPG